MARMQQYSKRFELWVTDFSTAVKYVRERQNTTLTLLENEDKTATVALTMAGTTADGLPLPKDVFNLPLTVRLELPEGVTRVEYTVGEATYTAPVRDEDGIPSAYIDLVPNGGEARISVT